jgi:hypothetical protein
MDKFRSMGIDVIAGDRAALDAWRKEELKRINEVVRISGARETR